MKKVFRVLMVLAIAAVVVGYFRNWYTLARVDEEQKTSITVTIDRQRVKEDLDLATKRARAVANRIRGQAAEGGDVGGPATGGETLWPTGER